MKSWESKLEEIKEKITAECDARPEKSVWQWTMKFVEDINNWEVYNANEFINKWIEARCSATGASHQVNLPPFKQVAGSKEAIKAAIDKQLDRGMPAGVNICSTILRTPNDDYTGIQSRGPNYYCTQKRCDCSPHSMMVVGRKKVGRICTYILRNSWGPGCSGYHQDYQKVGLCNPSTGDIALPADYLFNTAINTGFYE